MPPDSTGQRLVVSNHPLYIDAATNPGFTAATGTVVEYHEDIVDEDRWLAGIGEPPRARLLRDVVIVSDWAAAKLSARNLLAPIEGRPGTGEAATVVWAQGMVGVAYDAGRVEARLVRELRTIAELFRPPLHGRVSLPTDMRSRSGWRCSPTASIHRIPALRTLGDRRDSRPSRELGAAGADPPVR